MLQSSTNYCLVIESVIIMSKILQDVNLGANLRYLRKRSGMTQKDVCIQLEIMGRPMIQSNYAQIESGTRNLFVSDLILLKRIFRADYAEFFNGLEPIPKLTDHIE